MEQNNVPLTRDWRGRIDWLLTVLRDKMTDGPAYRTVSLVLPPPGRTAARFAGILYGDDAVWQSDAGASSRVNAVLGTVRPMTVVAIRAYR